MAHSNTPDWLEPLLEPAVTWIGAGVSGVVMLLSNAVRDKVSNIDLELKSQGARIQAIETGYVKREDFESVMGTLREDVNRSFDRAHDRIDLLYQNSNRT